MDAIALRAPSEADWHDVLAAADAAVPFDPAMNRQWLQNRRQLDATAVRRHYVAVQDGRGVGYGAVELRAPGESEARLFVVTAPSLLSSVGAALFERLTADARALGVTLLWLREYAIDAPLLRFLSDRGFVETARAPGPDGAFVYVRLERSL
jgi:N-acetylglutamate synthase-like GNAT family acetyltransferase